MKSSGYVSLGHLVCPQKSLSSDDRKKALRNFCTVLFCNMDESMVQSSTGLWRFDEFFKNVDPTSENMSKFLGGILKQPHANELRFQLGVEHVVWDMIKFGYDRYCSNVLLREDFFRLFCIFNRLCDPKTLLLGGTATTFLFNKFVQSPLPNFESTFENFADSISNWQRSKQILGQNYVVIIKKMYDDYVRDIIIESRVKFRFPYKNSVYGKGSILKKTISITSRNLTIYEDEEDRLANLDVPSKREPTGKIIHDMSLIGCESKISPSSKGLFSSRSKKFDVLSIRSAGLDTGVDIMFDTGKEIYDVYAWTNAIKEAIEHINSNSNRLIRLQGDVVYKGHKRSIKKKREQISSIQNVESHYSEISNLGSPADSPLPDEDISQLYRYPQRPNPPNKPPRKTLISSNNRKSMSLSNLSDSIDINPDNFQCPTTFEFSNYEALNVLDFLTSQVSQESEDADFQGELEVSIRRLNNSIRKPHKSKRTPPEKPTRKMLEVENANKRYQTQYIDLATQKMSEYANTKERSNSFADYGANEPDLIVSCRHIRNRSEEQISDQECYNDTATSEKSNELGQEKIENETASSIDCSDSIDEMVNHYSMIMTESFNFDNIQSGNNDLPSVTAGDQQSCDSSNKEEDTAIGVLVQNTTDDDGNEVEKKAESSAECFSLEEENTEMVRFNVRLH